MAWMAALGGGDTRATSRRPVTRAYGRRRVRRRPTATADGSFELRRSRLAAAHYVTTTKVYPSKLQKGSRDASAPLAFHVQTIARDRLGRLDGWNTGWARWSFTRNERCRATYESQRASAMERNGRPAAPCARAQHIRSRAVMLNLRISTPSAQASARQHSTPTSRTTPVLRVAGPMQRLRAKMEDVGVTLGGVFQVGDGLRIGPARASLSGLGKASIKGPSRGGGGRTPATSRRSAGRSSAPS